MKGMFELLQSLMSLVECVIWWRLMGSVLSIKYHKHCLTAASAVLFVIMICKQIAFRIPGMQYLQAVGTVAIIIFSFTATMLLFNNSLIEKLVWWGVYNFGLVASGLTAILLLSLALKKTLEQLRTNNLLGACIMLLTKILALLLFEIIIRKRRNKQCIGLSYYKELIMIIALNLVPLIGMVILTNNKLDIAQNVDYIILFFFGIVLLIAVFTIMMIINIEKKSNEEMITQLKLRKAEMELKLYEDMVSTTDRLRKLRHDMNNHIGLIKTLVYTGKYEELKSYIDQLYEDVEVANDLVITGNQTLSVLLSAKKSQAREKNIEFNSIIAIQEINMQDKDICTLIGNILDNALEAAEKAKGKKYIQLEIQKAKASCLISCENSLSDKPEVVNGRFLSKKDNANIHGIGMQNIRDIVEKYRGEITYDYSEGMFQIQVSMPV